jgi:hypothetical protein
MVTSFPEEEVEEEEEEEEEGDAMAETLGSVFTYGNYSIKVSPLNTRHIGRRLGFSSVLFAH